MQVLEASPPRNAHIHLTTFRDLERHRHDETKHAAYERLLNDLGVDVESFAALVKHPRLVLAEQPGCWFCADDVMRYRLLRILMETMDCHDSSGVLSLASDAFTCRGIKKLFILLHFHRELPPVHLLGAAYIRRYRNRTYHALRIEGSAYDRLATILDLCLAMLESSAVSPDAFAEAMIAIFRAGVRSGVRPLLPGRCDRRSLKEFGARMRYCDLEEARRPLIAARAELREGASWVRYWDRVNETFLGTTVGKLGPLFNQFLLTVKDPLRMSRHMMELCDHPADQPIPVAAIFAENDKYRMVFFDPSDDHFFYRAKAGARRTISWPRICSLALRGRTGGPAGTLEYLLMAASGIYLVADPTDGHNRFERQARKIHERYTGLRFPYVAYALDRDGPALDYLRIYTPEFERKTRAAIERFFE